MDELGADPTTVRCDVLSRAMFVSPRLCVCCGGEGAFVRASVFFETICVRPTLHLDEIKSP